MQLLLVLGRIVVQVYTCKSRRILSRVTASGYIYQILLNHFTRWCAWADMKIRVGKCSTFGVKISSTSSTQYLPNLTINHEVVPFIDIGISFRYRGRHFNYAIDNQIHMSEVLDLLQDLMNRIDSLSCHPNNKILLYHQFVLIQNLDNIVTKYVRQWLDLHISATLSTLVLQKSKYGINLILPSTKFTQCQTVIRNVLKASPNLDINAMWAATSSGSNLNYDQYKNTKQVLPAIKKDHEIVSIMD